MEPKVIGRFLSREVKLVQKDNYPLYGVIEEVFDDSIILRTPYGEKIVSIDFISSIVEHKVRW